VAGSVDLQLRRGARVVWKWEDEATARSIPHGKQPIKALAFDRDGKRLVATTQVDVHGMAVPGEMSVWDTANWRLLKSFPLPVSGAWSVAFHPDGKTVAVGGPHKDVRCFDPETGRLLYSLVGHAMPIFASASRKTASSWPVRVSTAR